MAPCESLSPSIGPGRLGQVAIRPTEPATLTSRWPSIEATIGVSPAGCGPKLIVCSAPWRRPAPEVETSGQRHDNCQSAAAGRLIGRNVAIMSQMSCPPNDGPAPCRPSERARRGGGVGGGLESWLGAQWQGDNIRGGRSESAAKEEVDKFHPFAVVVGAKLSPPERAERTCEPPIMSSRGRPAGHLSLSGDCFIRIVSFRSACC